jgi:capsular polysaccharide biosynthesis protein
LAGLAGVNIGSGQTYSDLAIYLIGTNTMLDSVVNEFDFITRYGITEQVRANSRNVLKNNLGAAYDERSGVFTITFTDYDPAFARQVVNYCIDYLSEWFNTLGLNKNELQKSNLEQNIQNTYKEIRRLEEDNHRLEQSVSAGMNSTSIPAVMLETRRIALELSAQQDVYRQLKVQLELINVAMASETPVFQILEMAEVPDQKSGPSRGMLCIIVTFAAFFFAVFLAFILNAVDNIKKDPEAMAKLKSKRRKDES